MLDPRLLYQFNPSLWESLRGTKPVMIHLLDGFLDAGEVGSIVADQILDHCEYEVLVRFDHDQLHDYRGRRPVMTFDTNKWVGAKLFELVLYKCVAPSGEVFVMLHGREPDLQWERVTSALVGLAQRLDVRLAVTAQGIPMTVPHTRPTLVTTHATRDALIKEQNPAWVGRVDMPGSLSSLLELRLGEAGVDAIGFAASVPHYLAQTAFPQAAVRALQEINEATGLQLPDAGLEERVLENLAGIAAETAESEEVQEVVAELERTFDENRTDRPVPTADEIGAELERFLAEQNRREDGKEEEN